MLAAFLKLLPIGNNSDFLFYLSAVDIKAHLQKIGKYQADEAWQKLQ